MNNKTVAQTFANGTKLKGQSSNGNLYFEGDTIYSYGAHFPIAYKTSYEFQGKTIVVFNDNYYSSSTAAHRAYVYRAMINDYEIIHTVNIKELIGFLKSDQIIDIALVTAIRAEMFAKIGNARLRMNRARKNTMKWVHSQEAKRLDHEQLIFTFLDNKHAIENIPF